jgi:hypothetical protein
VKVPGQDADVGEVFQQFRPETADAYGKAIGKTDDSTSGEDKIAMEAAHSTDLHSDNQVDRMLLQCIDVDRLEWGEDDRGDNRPARDQRAQPRSGERNCLVWPLSKTS